jgi:hypothetical protein
MAWCSVKIKHKDNFYLYLTVTRRCKLVLASPSFRWRIVQGMVIQLVVDRRANCPSL